MSVTDDDVRPSVPRTPTQAVLRIVSIVMLLLGALALLGGVLVLVTDGEVGAPSGNLWAVVTFGVIILVGAGLLLLTAVLGLAASNDSSRVEPYRFLCYLVGLVVLVAIVWGWGLGTFLLLNPIVLATTIMYVLVCSRLADRVKEEHDAGMTGELFLRSRHQRSLHLLSEVIILKGVLTAVVVGVMLTALLVYGTGERMLFSGVSITVDEAAFVLMAVGAVAAGLDLLVGCLGIWGSNRPFKIMPFLVVAALAFAADLVQVVASVIHAGGVGGITFDLLLDLLFMGTCTYLSFRIRQQPKIVGAVNELLATSSGMGSRGARPAGGGSAHAKEA